MTKRPKIAAIILCAGSGSRAGGTVAKQWQALGKKRVIDWAVAAFEDCPEISELVLVHPDGEGHHLVTYKDIHKTVTGGATRAQSVKNGLAALADTDSDFVLIHDGARPCLSRTVLDRCVAGFADHSALAPAVVVTDTLWRGADDQVCDVVSRDGLYQAQTPQGFDYKKLCHAHKLFVDDPTDDVQVARAAGMAVAIIEGDLDNIKITTAQDFDRAKRILGIT